MNQAVRNLERYKGVERYAHVDIDAVLHKVTQEVAELSYAQSHETLAEVYSEAGDVVVNMLSVASELGVDIWSIRDEGREKVEAAVLLKMLGDWNSAVQTYRNKYSRDDVSLDQLQSLTWEFVSTILSFADPCINLGRIIESNTQKIMERKDNYKPDINPKDYIAEYPDFPKPGINFKDISPILTNPDALRYICMEMAESVRGADKIVALDSRGFIFAPMISEILGIPWVMARKPGKLPGKTVSISYELEYGSNTIEMQEHAIESGEKVAIVDDLLATGGTACAAVALVEKLAGEVHSCNFVISLDEEFLKGFETRKNLDAYTCSHVVSYE